MEPGAGPSRAPQDRKAESQQQARAQPVEGHGRILLFGELWKQDEGCLTVQDVLEQAPDDHCARPSSTRTASYHSSCATRQRKRPGHSGWDSADCPAAKSRRCAKERRCDRCKATDPCECGAARAGSETSCREAAEEPPSGGWVPRPVPQRNPRLLLVLCRASALRSNLPRLQLLLQQVQARHRQPPAALVGIVVQPQPEEEAEARRRMETLLCSAFAPHSSSVEVHTAVFRPSRSDCVLDVQPAASTGRNARARGSVLLVDQETQTDGEGPDSGWGSGEGVRGNCKDGGSAVLVQGSGHIPHVTGPLLEPPLNTGLDEDSSDFSAQVCSLGQSLVKNIHIY